jgi:hypothetical protein
MCILPVLKLAHRNVPTGVTSGHGGFGGHGDSGAEERALAACVALEALVAGNTEAQVRFLSNFVPRVAVVIIGEAVCTVARRVAVVALPSRAAMPCNVEVS